MSVDNSRTNEKMNDAASSRNTSLQVEATESRLSIPVAVILEKTVDQTKKWPMPEWRVYAVVTGEGLKQSDQQTTIHEEDNCTRHYWGGMSINLYRDGGEGYWYNLMSETPYLFVVCDGAYGDQEISPAFVTANQDEANANMETDDLVLPVPMPLEIRELVERYVLSHYTPEIKKKRKRRDWLKESDYAKKS